MIRYHISVGLALAALLPWPGQAQANSMQEWAAQSSREIARRYRVPAGYGRPASALMTFVRFVVDREGRITNVVVAKGSGLAGVDDAALRAVRAAQPLKPPPLPYGEKDLRVTLPVAFR